MKIYDLTPLGQRVARSIRQEETTEWAVINYLDKRGATSIDQVKADIPGAGGAIAKLRNGRIIYEVNGG